MGKITAIGVGLEAKQLTLGAVELLSSGARVILHTGHIGCAQWLTERGIAFETLDELYDACDDFDEHARRAAEHVIGAAEAGDVVYAVYDVRDRSVLELGKRVRELRIVPGPPVEDALFAYLDGATHMLEASDWENFRLSPMDATLVREIDSRELAAEVKLRLMECYPDETRCYISNRDGISRLPLYDLDRMKTYDHRTCALVPPQRDLTKLTRFGFDELVRIMRILQAPDGCPWDRVQTHESLRPFLIEESYEVIDAINEKDPYHLYDELGDVLMQVVMHAELGRSHGEFDISDVTTAICSKMIARHTHIFGSDDAGDPDTVLDLWTKNKMKERGQRTHTEAMREVSRSFPALMRSSKLISKADRAGVRPVGAHSLVDEACALLRKLTGSTETENMVGDALFLICALAQLLGLDAEIALNEAADRFVQRFAELEEELGRKGMPLGQVQAEQAQLWERVKPS